MTLGWQREAQVIASSDRGPVTMAMLVEDFRALGLRPGSALIVHSSLRSLGWVCGGPRAVVLALQDVLGADGTVVVPTHTGLSDPASWTRRRYPTTGSRTCGTRCRPTTRRRRRRGAWERWPTPCGPGRARRSDHPEVPFAALGPAAAAITSGQTLDSPLGERSPLARLYDLGGSVLLLGVGHGNNPTLHLADDRAEWPGKHRRSAGAPLLVDGERRWVTWEQLDLDDRDFPELGAAFEASYPALVGRGRVGHADSSLLPVRPLVDFGEAWIGANRGGEAGAEGEPAGAAASG